MVVGRKIREKDMDITFGMTKTNTKASGLTICEKVKVKMYLKQVFIIGLMVMCSMENGTMTNVMDKE